MTGGELQGADKAEYGEDIALSELIHPHLIQYN